MLVRFAAHLFFVLPAAADFSYATRDGGKNSASFYGEAPRGGSFFRNAADAAKDTVKDVEGIFNKVKGRMQYDRDAPMGMVFNWRPVQASARPVLH